jgi:hypothetical protein
MISAASRYSSRRRNPPILCSRVGWQPIRLVNLTASSKLPADATPIIFSTPCLSPTDRGWDPVGSQLQRSGHRTVWAGSRYHSPPEGGAITAWPTSSAGQPIHCRNNITVSAASRYSASPMCTGPHTTNARPYNNRHYTSQNEPYETVIHVRTRV